MNESISSGEATLWITICRIATVLTTIPVIHIEPKNQDMWIVIILSIVYVIISAIPALFLANKFRELNFIEYIKIIFGSKIGKLIGMIYILFYIRIAVVFSYVTIQMVRNTFLPYTKPIVTIIFLIFTCLYISSKGSFAIGRFAGLLVPGILTIISILIILGFDNVDFGRLLPIYKDSTLWDINLGAIKITYLFRDLSILLMISSKVENKEKISTIFIKSVIYSSIFILVIIVGIQGAVGVEQAKHASYPGLNYIRLINIYSIFERVESIYIILLIFVMIIKITSYIHIADIGFNQVLQKKVKKQYLYIIGFICLLFTFYLAEVNPAVGQMTRLDTWEYIYYFIHKTVIPIVAVIVYFIRKRFIDSKDTLKD